VLLLDKAIMELLEPPRYKTADHVINPPSVQEMVRIHEE